MSQATQTIDRDVTCDECGQPFAQRANAFVERDGDIETVGLECAHCGARYVAYRTNSEIRALQEKVRVEVDRYRRRVQSGMDPRKAEQPLRKVRRKLEQAFKAFNGMVPSPSTSK